MRLRVYSIYDSGVKAFISPLTFRSEAEAFRTFSDAYNQPESPFKKYPLDYSLMFLGYWDDGTGQFEMETAPSIALTAAQVPGYLEGLRQ